MNVKTTVFAMFLALFAPLAAHAATVTFSAPGVVDSVEGLVVGGATYNVDFVSNLTTNQWGAALDFTSQAAADAAMIALNTALSAAGAIDIDYGTVGLLDSYAIPYDFTGSVLSYQYTDAPWSSTSSFSIAGSNSVVLAAADFTRVAAIPLPAGMALLTTALAGFVMMRRRRGAR